MAKIEGLNRLLKALEDMKSRYYKGKPPSVTVGYSQGYAVYVHEVPANHRVGQDKFLEIPARQLANDGTLKELIVKGLKAGAQLGPAILRAGMRIQRDAKPLTPEDTGALRASAFTCYTEDVESVADKARVRSKAVRQRKEAVI